MFFSNVTSSVGRTPIVALPKFSKESGVRILVKMESRNPTGSVKDRVGVALIEDAEARGILTPGATLIEPTSGNTGIALAFAAASKGYPLVLTMPERMSRERLAILKYLGAQVELTPGSLMRDAVARAQKLRDTIKGSVLLGQFENPANPECHRRTTAKEILEDTGGDVDCFIAGVGTGGTITGVGEVLKKNNPQTHIVAVEPKTAAVLSGGTASNHGIQGIGAGFIPKILNRNILDEIVAVDDTDAMNLARRLAAEEGILAGISSGANLWTALLLAKRPEFRGKTILTLVCDTGERYVNTPLFMDLVANR